MAAVTYDGVESAEGGNIFKDVKFWVATRVPTRKSILEMVTVGQPFDRIIRADSDYFTE